MNKKYSYEDCTCRYFVRPGVGNTQNVLKAVAQRANELGIGKIIIATYSGKSVLAAAKIMLAAKIVTVTTATGSLKPNVQLMKDATRQKLSCMGIQVLTCTHSFSGVGRGVRNKLGSYQVDEIIAYTLRIFGQGTKVAIEAAIMAADAGYVRTDEDVISTGGSAGGLDTALVLRPANATFFLDMKIREFICKPVDF